MTRVKLTWHERAGLTRSVIIADNIHIRSLAESLARAPKITQVYIRKMERGEKLKDRRD